MAKRESIQKKLQRVRAPRVQLTYDIEVGGAKETKELPFVIGVLGDFSAASDVKKIKLKNKKFIDVDLENIDEVMRSIEPRVLFETENTLIAEGTTLAIDLSFKSMKDFRPEQLVQQIKPLCQLMKVREGLTDLRNKISNNEKFEDVLGEVLRHTEQLHRLSIETGDNND
ncbi:type VI secretion system contractile sheath small subunit [Acinetobacter rudis]|uniref:type VI secretion system contractile sheath small subunit n=1 Tax=Acinetobacter rudis TaxID=632955 RepID=UPI00280E473C|nr:type VI secretion system contractile sheath small subunit [Acinetobacter rudis]MDQ8952383.1 type VI secretion system contractile sheath small subunit [Acinetobacter rudis]